jgi:glycosyltransferase involved in cell wall biosynthesis
LGDHSGGASATVGPELLEPPPIEPVAETAERPLWSVMIPTYNCAAYLRETLQGVLQQAPEPSAMQIEVVDDCSTKDDPEAVVEEIGRGRVAFFRQPKNGGAIENFNSCVGRARGHLVHVLHGDDHVGPGFYGEIERLVSRAPEAAIYATRSRLIDAHNGYLGRTPRVRPLERFTQKPNAAFYSNVFGASAVVVRRSFYEQHGGFLPALIHTADWEMWIRAFSLGGGVLSPKALADYRLFTGNHTSTLVRTGRNLDDKLKMARLFAARYAEFDLDRFISMCRAMAAYQATQFRSLNDEAAVAANLEFLDKLPRAQSASNYRLMEAVLRTWGLRAVAARTYKLLTRLRV